MSTRVIWLAIAVAVAGIGLGLAAPPAATTDTSPPSRGTPKAPKPPAAAEAAKNLAPTTDHVKNSPNLIVNGDFEEGDLTPRGWQSIDGLCAFWVKDTDPAHGKVLRIDTDVYQSQAYKWWPKIALGEAKPSQAPIKIPTVGEKYDTIAGLDGVWFWSDPIPCKKGASYWLTVDVKGPPMLVWLVGYEKKPDVSWGADNGAFQELLTEYKTGKPVDKGRDHEQFLHKYQWKGQLAVGGSDEWKTYSRREKPFRPTANTPKVRWLRVMLYPFWPPDVYHIDNVRLVERVAEPSPEP